MTLIAAMSCKNGAVICADSQESVGDYQYSVEKLVSYRGACENIVVAGSGRAGLVDMVTEQAIEALDGGARSFLDYRNRLQSKLASIYLNEIAAYPAPPEDKLVDIVVGINSPESDGCCLLKAEGPAVSFVKDFYVAGVGRAVTYELEQTYRPRMSLRYGVISAIHILQIAKTALHTVGGRGTIATLTNDGRWAEEPDWNIFEIDRFFYSLKCASAEFLIHVSDGEQSMEEFHVRMKAFNDRMSEAHEHNVKRTKTWGRIMHLIDPPRQSASQTSESES